MSTLAIYFLVALALSLALTPICRLVAERLGCVAKPSQDRWHRRPTALFGGVAVVAVVVGLALTIEPRGSIWHLIGAGALIAAFGFVDDIMSLKAVDEADRADRRRVAAAVLRLPAELDCTRCTLDAMLTLFWVVGITNAFNLLDNMDGLCAGIAMIVAGAFLLICAGRGRTRVSPQTLLPGDLARRDRRLPRLQLPPGVDFHGRHRQPVSRVQPRRADAARQAGGDGHDRPAVDRRRAGAASC